MDSHRGKTRIHLLRRICPTIPHVVSLNLLTSSVYTSTRRASFESFSYAVKVQKAEDGRLEEPVHKIRSHHLHSPLDAKRLRD